MSALSQPYRFSRADFYAIADRLDPKQRYELLAGTIYPVSPANPPHAGVVTYLTYLFGEHAGPDAYLVRVQDTLEIEPDGAPQPDLAVVRFCADFYRGRHPNGSDALLVIEVADSERKPCAKMIGYMRDGRIPVVWCVDIPSRRLEVWTRASAQEPTEVLAGESTVRFGALSICVGDLFAGIGAA